jgi:large subunit ribosomal protein L17
MNHRKALRKLGRNPSHRKALLRNLSTQLVLKGRLETTIHKAKELKRVADKLITLGKNDTLHARRLAMQYLIPVNRCEEGNAQKLTPVHKLFTEWAPRFAERNGGYTRVVRTRVRKGDCAQMAVIEFVEAKVGEGKVAKKKRVVKKVAESKETESSSKKDSKPKTKSAKSSSKKSSE